MNGKARNFIPALANYNEQSWTLHNIMCRVSNWMGWNDNNTVLSRTVGRSEKSKVIIPDQKSGPGLMDYSDHGPCMTENFCL